jgi:hypothetical protein
VINNQSIHQSANSYYINKGRKIADFFIGIGCVIIALFITPSYSNNYLIFIGILAVAGISALFLKRKYIFWGIALAYPMWVLFFFGWVMFYMMLCHLSLVDISTCSMP